MSKNRRSRHYSIGGLPEPILMYVVPWAVGLAVWPVAAGLHLWIGRSPLWVAVLTTGFIYLARMTWRTWAIRRKDTQIMATVFVSAVLTWAVFATVNGPWQGDIVKAWALGGLALCASWCMRHAAIAGAGENDKSNDEKQDGLLSRIRAFKNAKVHKVEETEDQLNIGIDLEPGVTAKEAQDARDQIASVARVDASEVKVLKTKGNEGRVNTAFTRGADNSEPLVYKGPKHLGRSIADAPLWLGRRTDGSDIEWWISGDTNPKKPRPLAHTKCTGTSGAGKTDTICTAILAMRERIDLVPVVADPAKFQQSFGDIEEALGLAAKDERQSKQLVWNLIEAIKYRAGLFGTLTRADGGTGYKQWEPELFVLHGIPELFVDIEEATDIITDLGDDLDEVARKLRSIGIHLCVSMQTMPWDNIPRKTRGLFGQSLAHGQIEDRDAQYALRKETLDAGADPTKWGNDSPGSLYAELVGTDKSHWPVDGRVVCMTPEDKKRSMALSRKYWAQMDPGTYAILSRGIVETEPAVVHEQAAEAVAMEEQDFDREPMMSMVSKDGIDVSAPLTPPRSRVSVQFADRIDPSRVTDDDARAELLNRIEILWNSGQREVTYQDMGDLPELVQRQRGWIFDEFEQLAGLGLLRQKNPPNTKAVYDILGPPNPAPVPV